MDQRSNSHCASDIVPVFQFLKSLSGTGDIQGISVFEHRYLHSISRTWFGNRLSNSGERGGVLCYRTQPFELELGLNTS